MDIKEANKLKKIAEDQIVKIIEEFEEQTGLRVGSSITFNASNPITGRRKIISVHLSVVLS